MSPFFESHAGVIYVTQIICIIVVSKITSYVLQGVRVHWLNQANLFFGNIALGVFGGMGFVRIYHQHWPIEQSFSLEWFTTEILPFVGAATIVGYVIAGLTVLLKRSKRT